jgi:anti-sigma regulatory factor (Ser/Thr protein kinase)
MRSDSPEDDAALTAFCPERLLPASSRLSRATTLPRRSPLSVPLVRVLPGTAQSAAVARRLARRFVGPGHPAADTVALIVSELVTNSVTHSRSGAPGGTVTVAISRGSAGVLIQVRDDGGPSGQWMSAAPGSAAEHGYGLLLVDALADNWGTLAGPQGRVTWCRVGGAR